MAIADWLDSAILTRLDTALAAETTLAFDYKIRTSIADLIKRAAPKAVVINRNDIYSVGANGEPAMFRSAGDANKVHGWMIARRAGEKTREDGRGVNRTHRYVIVGMHYFDFGTDASNSETLFQLEVDRVSVALDLVKTVYGGFTSNGNPFDFTVTVDSNAGALVHKAVGYIGFEKVNCG